ncbi:MAG: HAD family hydrolase, partial [Nanoarchaeota archaeon]
MTAVADIKVVLWDIGGVIQPDDRLPPAVLGISQHQYEGLIRTEEYRNYLKGLIGFEEVAKFILSYLGRDATQKNMQRVREAIESNWESPQPDVIAIIGRINQAKFRRMILSNSSVEVEEKAREAHRTGIYKPEHQSLQLFQPENIIFSHRIHAMKPQAEAFAALQNVCKVSPRHWLFIDDRQANLDAARDF